MKSSEVFSDFSSLSRYFYKFLVIGLLLIALPLVFIIILAVWYPGIVTNKWLVLALAIGFVVKALAMSYYLMKKHLFPLEEVISTVKSLSNEQQLVLGNGESLTLGEEILTPLKSSLNKLDYLLKEKHDIIEILSQQTIASLKGGYEMAEELVGKATNNEINHLAANLKRLVESNIATLSFVLEVLKSDSVIGIQLTPKKVVVSAEINTILSQYRVILKQKNLNVCLRVKDDFFVVADPSHFHQVLQSLIYHVIDFAAPKDVIVINTVPGHEYKLIYIGVQDLSIHQKHTSFPPSLEEIDPLVGFNDLGLYLALKIMEKHHGKIKLFSDEHGESKIFSIEVKHDLKAVSQK